MNDTPKRHRINDRQCRLFLNDMIEFGYTNTTFEGVRRVADEVAEGTHDQGDPIAIIMAKQIDEAQEMREKLGRGRL